ncbi:MAG: hypothetical protein EXS29_01820 [Pedosphaera sp.]|nr:hypothetical protein [Pedosphaera sp.]MST00036.1 hypothetical protein [Pedosphaera sp.]
MNVLIRTFFSPLAVVALLVLAVPSRVLAAEPILNVEVRLVWGTDDAKSPHADFKKMDPKLAETLRRSFRWTEYYEGKMQKVQAPSETSQRVTLADDCYVELKNLGKSKIEVKYFTGTKQIGKTVNTLPPQNWLTVGSVDKSNSAKFVMMRLVPEKAAKKETKEPKN